MLAAKAFFFLLPSEALAWGTTRSHPIRSRPDPRLFQGLCDGILLPSLVHRHPQQGTQSASQNPRKVHGRWVLLLQVQPPEAATLEVLPLRMRSGAPQVLQDIVNRCLSDVIPGEAIGTVELLK